MFLKWVFTFLQRHRISKQELIALRNAERVSGLSLVETYKRLPRTQQRIFFQTVKRLNQEHSEYIEAEKSFIQKCSEMGWKC